MSDAYDRTVDLEVEGMTCAHCVQHVTAGLEALTEVEAVSVTLKAGGISKINVVINRPVADEVFAQAIEEAGYDLKGVHRDF